MRQDSSNNRVIADYPPQTGGGWDCQCARCGSTCDWQKCGACDDGLSGHDCGEDCCCCLDPEPNVPCDICEGHGGWWSCLSSAEWCEKNPLPNHEEIERGKIEWFQVDEE